MHPVTRDSNPVNLGFHFAGSFGPPMGIYSNLGIKIDGVTYRTIHKGNEALSIGQPLTFREYNEFSNTYSGKEFTILSCPKTSLRSLSIFVNCVQPGETKAIKLPVVLDTIPCVGSNQGLKVSVSVGAYSFSSFSTVPFNASWNVKKHGEPEQLSLDEEYHRRRAAKRAADFEKEKISLDVSPPSSEEEVAEKISLQNILTSEERTSSFNEMLVNYNLFKSRTRSQLVEEQELYQKSLDACLNAFDLYQYGELNYRGLTIKLQYAYEMVESIKDALAIRQAIQNKSSLITEGTYNPSFIDEDLLFYMTIRKIQKDFIANVTENKNPPIDERIASNTRELIRQYEECNRELKKIKIKLQEPYQESHLQHIQDYQDSLAKSISLRAKLEEDFPSSYLDEIEGIEGKTTLEIYQEAVGI